jgi:hypothetical protein
MANLSCQAFLNRFLGSQSPEKLWAVLHKGKTLVRVLENFP